MASPMNSIAGSESLHITRAITGLLAIIVPLCSTLAGCLSYQFINYISHLQSGYSKTLTAMATFTMLMNIAGMILEISIFKSFTHHALVDSGLIKIYRGPLWALIIVNYLMSTASRIHFARLASTMLRSPQFFLSLSATLLVLSVGGLTLKSVHIAIHVPHSDLSRQSGQILVNRNQILAAQLLWYGSIVIWDAIISGVLLYNFYDQRRRVRFGTIDGNCSFGIALVFESFLMVTIATFLIAIAGTVLVMKLEVDYGRLSVIYAGLGSIAAKFDGISMLCSLQHKVNDHLRFDQKLAPYGSPCLLKNLKNPGGFHIASGQIAEIMPRNPPTVKFPYIDDDLISCYHHERSDIEEVILNESINSRLSSRIFNEIADQNSTTAVVSRVVLESDAEAESRESIDEMENCAENVDSPVPKKNPRANHDKITLTDDKDLLPTDRSISLPPPTLQLRPSGIR